MSGNTFQRCSPYTRTEKKRLMSWNTFQRCSPYTKRRQSLSRTFQEDTADRPYLPHRSFHLQVNCTFHCRRPVARNTPYSHTATSDTTYTIPSSDNTCQNVHTATPDTNHDPTHMYTDIPASRSMPLNVCVCVWVGGWVGGWVHTHTLTHTHTHTFTHTHTHTHSHTRRRLTAISVAATIFAVRS
jgi:hypothetical protein